MEGYKYYPIDKCAKYMKWYDDHEEDMSYRYSGGKQVYTLKEIMENGELNKISNY